MAYIILEEEQVNEPETAMAGVARSSDPAVKAYTGTKLESWFIRALCPY